MQEKVKQVFWVEGRTSQLSTTKIRWLFNLVFYSFTWHAKMHLKQLKVSHTGCEKEPVSELAVHTLKSHLFPTHNTKSSSKRQTKYYTKQQQITFKKEKKNYWTLWRKKGNIFFYFCYSDCFPYTRCKYRKVICLRIYYTFSSHFTDNTCNAYIKYILIVIKKENNKSRYQQFIFYLKSSYREDRSSWM